MSDPSANGSRPGLVRDRPDAIIFSKTISESDVYAFAAITGAF